MIKHCCLYLFFVLAALMASHARVATANQPDGKPYNVLFIAIDDLNDWVGCLEGVLKIAPNSPK